MDKKKEEIIELADTINDTPIFIYDNTTPTCINSKIIDNPTKIEDIIYINHFSNIDKNILNNIKMDKKPENKILLQRENRRIISIIKKIISRNETDAITKELIKATLINYKNDITLLKDDKKNTLLHIFVQENNINAINIILEIYLDILTVSKNYYFFIFSKNIDDLNVFDISVQRGNNQIIKLLYEQIEKEDNYNEKKVYMKYFQNNIFHISANNNQFFPIIFFYENLRNFYLKYFYKVEGILDSHELKNDKMTPIHYACKNQNIKLMNLLIDLGANINSQDIKGYTPLHYAVTNHDERTVKHLLIRGANKFIKDYKNLTPYNLSFMLGDKNLSEILYHKNFCQRQFCGEEIGPISKKNNMCFLFICLLFTIILKISIIFRFYCVFNNIILDFSILFSLNNNDYLNFCNNKTKTFSLNDFFPCLDDNCRCEAGILFSSLAIDLILLIVFLTFKCSKGVFLDKKKESEESLSDLYEENDYICVKCRIAINDNTQHCLICNRCIENWDHHCFWLNTCINDKNYNKFKLFMISAILFLFINLIFYIDSLYLFISSKDLFIQEIFLLSDDSMSHKILKIIIICVEAYFIITISYSLFFVVLPIIKYIYTKSIKRRKKKNEKEIDSLGDIIVNEEEDNIMVINTANRDL